MASVESSRQPRADWWGITAERSPAPGMVCRWGSESLAWVVAIMLGAAVVVAGLRRNLADTPRSWLPRPGGVPEREVRDTEVARWGRRPRPLTPRQRRWMVGGFLLLGLAYAAMALLGANDRLVHAVFAAMWAIIAVAYFLGKLPLSVNRPGS